MASLFHASIIARDKTLFEGDIESLVAPCGEGYIGFLAHHAPFMGEVIQGTIRIRDASGKEQAFPVQGKGFIQLLKNEGTVILDQ
jgi:F-type H+-transporting ATPase subunit epsilon